MLWLPAQSQSGKGYFDRFGLSEGLSQSTVNCAYQDSYGLLWVGTDDGLNLFDGYNFRVFQHNPADSATISNNVIRCIYEDFEGIIWVGTASGLNRYDRFKNEFDVFRYSSENQQSISDNTITAIQPAGESHLWVGTRNGLNLLDKRNQSFTVFNRSDDREVFSLSNGKINDLAIDKQGRLWCGTDAGLSLMDSADSTFMTFGYEYGAEDAIAHPTINCLAVDQWGNIWAGTQAGISMITPNLEVQQIMPPQIPESEGFTAPVYSIMTARDHLVWIGTENDLLCVDDQGEVLRKYENELIPEQSLGGGRVLCLLEDRSGAVWIGTNSGGLYRYTVQQQIFDHIQPEKKMGGRKTQQFWSVVEKNETSFYAGGGDGVYLNQASGLLHFENIRTGKSPDINTDVKSILEIGDSYFVGTLGQGLYEFDQNWRIRNHYTVTAGELESINSNRINCLLYDSEMDGIWIGTTGGGLNFLDLETKKFKNWNWNGSRNMGMIDNHVNSLVKDGYGNLWIGTANRGLSKMDIATERFQHIEYQSDRTGRLSSNNVNHVYCDSNERLWVSTKGGGLNMLAPHDSVFKVYRSFDGLPSNTVTAVIQDGQGLIWATTNSGLVRLDLEENDFRKFNEADGLRFLEFLPGAIGKLQSGDLWMGSTKGIVCLNSESFVANTYAPPVVFTEVSTTLADGLVQREKNFFPQPDQPVEFDHHVRTISIEFALLNLIQANKNNYAYRIDGVVEGWSHLGNRHKITFTNLDPGRYVVMVKGGNYDGIWNARHSEIVLLIHPAFWQTAWFRFLVVVLIGFLIYGLYRWRIAQVKDQNRMLEAIVRERTKEIAQERDEKSILLKEIHHRVKNNLQIISSLLSLQSRFADDEKIEHLLLESTNRVQSMSMIHEKMYRSENLKEINVQQYISELVDALVAAYSVKKTIKSTVEVEVDRFAVDTLTPLGLIINELIANSLKYGFEGRTKGEIFLKIKSLQNSNYEMIVGDDGVGFSETDMRQGGFGTELVKDLAEQLQGSIERVQSNAGTTFRLLFNNIDNH